MASRIDSPIQNINTDLVIESLNEKIDKLRIENNECKAEIERLRCAKSSLEYSHNKNIVMFKERYSKAKTKLDCKTEKVASLLEENVMLKEKLDRQSGHSNNGYKKAEILKNCLVELLKVI